MPCHNIELTLENQIMEHFICNKQPHGIKAGTFYDGISLRLQDIIPFPARTIVFHDHLDLVIATKQLNAYRCIGMDRIDISHTVGKYTFHARLQTNGVSWRVSIGFAKGVDSGCEYSDIILSWGDGPTDDGLQRYLLKVVIFRYSPLTQTLL